LKKISKKFLIEFLLYICEKTYLLSAQLAVANSEHPAPSLRASAGRQPRLPGSRHPARAGGAILPWAIHASIHGQGVDLGLPGPAWSWTGRQGAILRWRLGQGWSISRCIHRLGGKDSALLILAGRRRGPGDGKATMAVGALAGEAGIYA